MSPEQLIHSHFKLLSLPTMVARLNPLVDDPTTSATDIARVIAQDAALTARLLKIVNCPFYRLPAKIDSLDMALSVLDTHQLRDLVLSAAVIKRFQTNIDPAFDVEVFWCHSITTAIAARLLASKMTLANPERFFVTGLLHDIGKMVMYLTLPNESFRLIQELEKPGCDVANIEQQLFGFTHDDVGVALLKAWNFPESIIGPVRYHALLNANEQDMQDAALLHIANNIANNMQEPISRDDDTPLNQKATEVLQLTPEVIEEVYEETYHHLDELLEIFYYDLVT